MKFGLIFLYIFYSFVAVGQSVSSPSKTRFAYIVPTGISGGIVSLDNIWMQLGYGVLKNKKMCSFEFGTIIYSPKSIGEGLYWSNLSQQKSRGVTLSFEYKYFMTNRFFFSGNVYYRFMKTTREEFVLSELDYSLIHNYYDVLRNEIGFIPKIGIAIYQKGKLSCDFSFGTGIRYVYSSSNGKIHTEGNMTKEYFTNKPFDTGGKIAQRIALHINVGYVF